MKEAYRKVRWVVTLAGLLRVNSHILECQSEGCRERRARHRPEKEGALALPHYTFGLEVVARIGELRYGEHQTVEEIARELKHGGVGISTREVQLLSEVFLALVESSVKGDPQLVERLRAQGGIILAIDGVQPEKGNETLWLLRDVRSERVLVARNLLSSGRVEIEPLIAEVKALGVPVLGVISDKQAAVCLAVEQALPGVPHQLSHFHYLRDVAQPVAEADRKLKKQLKQQVRGIREVERRVAHQPEAEAATVRGYCVAVREVMRDDGKYPLEPAGITLYERLNKIRQSLGGAIRARSSAQLQRLHTILDALTTQAKEYARLVVAWSWIHHLARLLDQGASRAEAEAQLRRYAGSLPRKADQSLSEMATHIEKITTAFAPKLFAFHDQPLLPKTNNELEVFIGQLKKERRRVTGRKDTTAFILREGRAVALLHSLPSEPNWLAAFAAVEIEQFQKSLAELRRADERSQAWQARRDLDVYLSLLEQDWPPD
ncbi:MAG TPA: ISNCY family transposase [Blastocatellia bacterium]|nr:ISNCY family transposase [Blastocatellia bacterium]